MGQLTERKSLIGLEFRAHAVHETRQIQKRINRYRIDKETFAFKIH